MPEEGVPFKEHKDILRFEEIVEVVKTGVKLGINKIRFTGGEPLVRKGIVDLIREVASIEGITDIGLTTNGVLLPQMAKELKEAGLKRVNISLDTLDPEKFRKITRTGKLEEVLKGIEAAIEADLTPVKINFVRIKGFNETDEVEVRHFCEQKGLKLRFIRQMNLDKGEFYAVEGGDGGVCHKCNRLRLTADGQLVPCLFSDFGFSIREMGIEEAFYKALNKKPLEGKQAIGHEFYNIGG
jgi:cyclic pyranopterin phosphate synthase